jgi:hypothetical protein
MANGAATSYVMQSFMGAVNRMDLFNQDCSTSIVTPDVGAAWTAVEDLWRS